ncbi:MAG: hypothetical protein H0W08_08150 [Acidobacteria bacterium]|nr:hypothetical protein [Acidobacteriota bacterium]
MKDWPGRLNPRPAANRQTQQILAMPVLRKPGFRRLSPSRLEPPPVFVPGWGSARAWRSAW